MSTSALYPGTLALLQHFFACGIPKIRIHHYSRSQPWQHFGGYLIVQNRIFFFFSCYVCCDTSHHCLYSILLLLHLHTKTAPNVLFTPVLPSHLEPSVHNLFVIGLPVCLMVAPRMCSSWLSSELSESQSPEFRGLLFLFLGILTLGTAPNSLSSGR